MPVFLSDVNVQLAPEIKVRSRRPRGSQSIGNIEFRVVFSI